MEYEITLCCCSLRQSPSIRYAVDNIHLLICLAYNVTGNSGYDLTSYLLMVYSRFSRPVLTTFNQATLAKD
jgi:hypothetical protein